MNAEVDKNTAADVTLDASVKGLTSNLATAQGDIQNIRSKIENEIKTA